MFDRREGPSEHRYPLARSGYSSVTFPPVSVRATTLGVMSRLCERPGCSETAAVAYGMLTEDLVFWLDALNEGADPASGVLCLRHGDSMVVPRGWTLNDLRDPDLHLFRPPAVVEPTSSRHARRRSAASAAPSGQLALDGVEATVEAEADAPPMSAEPVVDRALAESGPDDDGAGTPDSTWRPTFDADDDLDGLLAARSPLLSRAFRGTDKTT